LDRVALMYEEFFQQVLNLRGPGWPIEFPGRRQLDWLRKSYPLQGTRHIDLDIPHCAPEIQSPPKPSQENKTEWEQAQEWENWWWNDNVPNRLENEVEKQDSYARLMGLPNDLNLKTTKILDLGCGPASILLRCHHGPSVGIDPLKMKPDVLQRYANHGVILLNMKIEDAIVQDRLKGQEFDEVWTYNCLQHVDNLDLILDFMTKIAPVVRLFEWVDLGKCPGHPHTLTEEMFLKRFPEKEWTHKIWNPGILRGFGGTATNKYLALHVIRKESSR
jgi:SAM-dependent methyltransferase